MPKEANKRQNAKFAFSVNTPRVSVPPQKKDGEKAARLLAATTKNSAFIFARL
jgi:hypothetical protein